MKTQISPDSRRAHLLRLLLVMAAVALLSLPLPGADVPGEKPAKPYTLYLGANLTVEWHGKLWPVCGVQRNSFVIEADGRRVPVRDTDLRMKIDRTLKLTTTFATIADVKAERDYTPANDPRHHAHDTMMAASQALDDLDINTYNLNNLQSIAARDAASGHPSMVTPGMLAEAGAAFQRSLSDQGSTRYSVANAISREQDELARKLFDAFRLSFDVSSREPLTDPYLVLMVRFRNKEGDPKTTRMLVYAQVLPTIGERRQTVRLFRGGFPRGYQLVDYQIHLYDHGTEIATSAAPKGMAMTSDEAYQYSIADYVVRHRGKTLPPAPAWAFWPTRILAGLPLKERNWPLYVKVSKDGSASGFYGDKACTRPIRDADLETVRPELRFNPALEKGKPVGGIVSLNLGRGPD